METFILAVDFPENGIGPIVVSLKRTKPCLFIEGLLCVEWECSSVCLVFMAKHLISWDRSAVDLVFQSNWGSYLHLFMTAILQWGMTTDISKRKHFHWNEYKRTNGLIWAFGKLTSIWNSRFRIWVLKQVLLCQPFSPLVKDDCKHS